MIAPAALLAFAAVASLFGRRVLAHASWTVRAPALGIAAWQALTLAIALAIVFAGFTLALPQLNLTSDLARLLQACVEEIRHQYGTPAGAALGGSGALLAGGIAVRFAASFILSWWRSGRDRRRHLARLSLVTEELADTGVTLVEHQAPLVYCLPGRQSRIVVTSAAAHVLSEHEMRGVLAHERAHLHARHHLAITLAATLAATFFNAEVFRVAVERIKMLAEMHADDAAGARHRRDLASALLHLTGSAAPAGALGAGGDEAVARILRLSKPRSPLPPRVQLSIVACTVGVVLVPVALALFPAGLALLIDCCKNGLAAL